MQATQDQLGAYVFWLQDRGLRFPVKTASRGKKAVQVVFVGDTGFTDVERDLLGKMIQAMHLTGEHVVLEHLEDFEEFAKAHAPTLIIPLGQAAAASCPGDTIPTLHPRDLIARPGDKRIAWDDLKRAMVRLKS